MKYLNYFIVPDQVFSSPPPSKKPSEKARFWTAFDNMKTLPTSKSNYKVKPERNFITNEINKFILHLHLIALRIATRDRQWTEKITGGQCQKEHNFCRSHLIRCCTGAIHATELWQNRVEFWPHVASDMIKQTKKKNAINVLRIFNSTAKSAIAWCRVFTSGISVCTQCGATNEGDLAMLLSLTWQVDEPLSQVATSTINNINLNTFSFTLLVLRRWGVNTINNCVYFMSCWTNSKLFLHSPLPFVKYEFVHCFRVGRRVEDGARSISLSWDLKSLFCI